MRTHACGTSDPSAHRHVRRGVALFAAILLLPVLSGCGDNAPPPIPDDPAVSHVIGTSTLNLQGEHAGIGSSAQQAAIEAWAAGYSHYQPHVTVAYDPQGSGAGVTSFLQGAVSWAGTDVALTADQRSQSTRVCGGEKAVDFPVYISPIAFVYNLPGLNSAHITLSAGLIADIFTGSVLWWDDPQITALNPKISSKLPHTRITSLWRSDKSGTSQIVSTYLHSAAPKSWPYTPGKVWPVTVGQGAKGTAGVSSAAQQAVGTFGYVDSEQAGDLGVVAILQDGASVLPSKQASAEFAVAALKRSVKSKMTSASGSPIRDLTLSADYADTSAKVYPVTQMSYLVTCPAFADRATQQFVGSWLVYISSPQAQELSAQVAGSVPLPRELGEQIGQAGRWMLKETQ